MLNESRFDLLYSCFVEYLQNRLLQESFFFVKIVHFFQCPLGLKKLICLTLLFLDENDFAYHLCQICCNILTANPPFFNVPSS